MTAQTNKDRESGAVPRVNPGPENGVSCDSGPCTDDKGQSLLLKVPPQKLDEQEAPPSRHLWVGNVSTVLTEAALAEHFARFGDIDSVTVYSSRNYAFVNFKTVDDAVYAKKGLHGALLGGLTIRIEFAKGAKPCRNLWISNICSSVTKEQLEAEFKRFGVVEDLRFLRDRSCAFVDFTKTDDAICALESLNRKKLGKEELHIEYGRSTQQSKKDSKFETHQSQVDERIISQEQGILDPRSSSNGGDKVLSEKSKGDKDGDPSEVLWVGFPIYMKVDERKLHRVFAPFGVIERITTFPGRTYAFVQFQNVRQASRAKDALQGKLFNDPRVNISFAKSEVGPVDHSRGTSTFLSPSPPKVELNPIISFSKASSYINPRNDRFLSLGPFRPNSPSYSTRSGANLSEANVFVQSSRYEPERNLSMGNEFSRPGPDRGQKPEMELWGSPAMPEGAFVCPNHVPFEDRWNFQEEALGKREVKRQRVGGGHPGGGGLIEPGALDVRGSRQPFQDVKAHEYMSRITRLNGSDTGPPESWEDQEGPKRVLQGAMPFPGSGVDPSRAIKDDWSLPGVPTGPCPFVPPKDELRWQGIIAKSGTSVCHAQCFPVSKAVDVTFPEVLNCTARTNLDMLAKHISQVGDFAVVSFVPQGEVDVGPYQEFIIYLSEKKRAAVCKLSQETTLFLVPPSEFVEQFLRVPKNNCVFGVVLKLHQQSSQLLAEQAALPQPMQSQRLISVNGLMEERYHRLTSHASSERQGSETMPVPSNAVPSPEMMATHPFPPQQSNFQSSAGALLTSGTMPPVGSMAGNMLGRGLVGLNNLPGHGIVMEDSKLAHHPYGYPPMQHDQHNSPLISGASLVPVGEMRSNQEQGMLLSGPIVVPPPGQAAALADQYPMPIPGHGPSHMKINGQNFSGSLSFQQQPRPPQFPSSNRQTSQTDQISQITSHVTHQPQPFPEQNMQHQLPLNGQQHFVQQTVPNFPLISEASSATGIPPPHPAGPLFQGGNPEVRVGADQNDMLQVAQEKPSPENHSKGDSDEDHKRFQATLELAAALLQQLQKQTKT